MNKHRNPFVPQPFSHPPQPALPPARPPTQPGAQQDYSAYWAAAAAHQSHAAGQAAYNPQWATTNGTWTAPQPAPTAPKPTPEQTALYANYGYGGQQSLHWQQQAQAQLHHQPHYIQPVPVAHPPTAPAAPAQYNPYQPQAVVTAYPQPYAPQVAAPPTQPAAQQPFRPPQPPQQSFLPANPHRPPNHPHPSPHVPPAKRQRFDHPQNPPQPRFQPPPPPPLPQQTGSHDQHRPSGPGAQTSATNQTQNGSFGGNRGGGVGGGRGLARGGRGGSMNMNRGGANRSGRGGGMYGGSGRGGQAAAPSRGNSSRDRGGFGNQNRRGGGSFGGQNNFGGASFRAHGRSGGPNHSHHSRGGRTENNQNKALNATIGGSGGKKEENKRTLTDFKLVGLEIQNLDWRWGTVPHLTAVQMSNERPEVNIEIPESSDTVKTEEVEMDLNVSTTADVSKMDEKANGSVSTDASSSALSAPPSRLRIYFHTPPSPDDARPIVQASSFSDTRKGKRKKSEDDDGDLEEPRAPPPRPIPHGSLDGDGTTRSSVAPSVTETVSEGDWLLAAIAQGNGDNEDQAEEHEISHDLHDDGNVDEDENMSELGAQQNELMETQEHNDEHNHQAAEQTTSEAPMTDARAEPANGISDVAHDMEETQGISESKDVKSGSEHDDGGTQDESTFLYGITEADSEPLESTQVESTPEPSADVIPQPEAESSSTNVDSAQSVSSVSSTVPGGDAEDEAGRVEQPSSGEATDAQAVHANGVDDDTVHADEVDDEKPFELPGFGMDAEQEHLPEPPASPASVTLPSSSSTTVSTHLDGYVPATKVVATDRLPSANRLSISYAAGARRLVIDADIVEKLSVHRADGRIEVAMTVERLTNGFKGILIEALDEATKSYTPLQDLSEASESDQTLPPFWCFVIPTKTTLVVYLDTDRPLSEPKWVKTGDVQDWLKSLFGRMFWVAGDAVGWERKIDVIDPDPPPTIQSVMESWSTNSPVGSVTERQRFLKTHLAESDNILEILLRLVRGERATPFSQAASAISTPSVSGPLLSALNAPSDHGSQQTHVSLAVLAIARMAIEYAEKAVGAEKGKLQVQERLGEIVRCLPSHLLYKSLDGMFKEWRVEKKGRRT